MSQRLRSWWPKRPNKSCKSNSNSKGADLLEVKAAAAAAAAAARKRTKSPWEALGDNAHMKSKKNKKNKEKDPNARERCLVALEEG